MDGHSTKFPWHRCNRYCNLLDPSHCDLVYTEAAPAMEQVDGADWRFRDAYAHHPFVTIIGVQRAETPSTAHLTPISLRRVVDPEAAPSALPPDGAALWLVWWTW